MEISFYKKLFPRLALASLLLSIFLLRFYQTDPQCKTVVEEKITFQGYIEEMPDERHKNTRLTLETEEGENFLITILPYPRFSYGDRVEITGNLESPNKEESFTYAKYLESKGICSLMYMPKIVSLNENIGNPFWKWMYAVKQNFLNHLQGLFPEPQASFAAGLLLGDRKGLPENVTEDFRRAGVSHIIALSGFNITILFAFIIFLLQRFSRKVQFFISTLFMLWFVFITGASPSIVRAGIMGFLAFFGRIIGRPSSGLRILFFSAAIMVFVNPRLLLYDPGFQLSFLATFGLITIGEKIGRFFSWIKISLIREPFVQTLSATIPTIPILIFNFGQISFIAPISNVLILPLIPFAMLFSGIPLFLDYFSHPLAGLVAWWGNLLLIFILKIAEWMSDLPFASWSF